MDNITKKYGYNTRNIRDIIFRDINTLTLFPLLNTANGLLDINTAETTNDWNMLLFTPNTAMLTEEEIEIAGAPAYKITLTCSVPQRHVGRVNNFIAMHGKQFYLVVRDNNNRSWIIGYQNIQDEKYGATLRKKFTTDKTNAYALEFALTAPAPAPEAEGLSETVIIIHPPPPPPPDTIPIDVSEL